jgi:hypothetical protein
MNQVPKIGAFVLETLTTGMYTNPLDSIREFVQNASDSIRSAEEQGLIAKGEGCIEIKLDPRTRNMVVRDNGTGISQTEVYNRLIHIGMSNKSIETDAGFRGIGRLAGIAYCKALHFRTSGYGEAIVSQIEMDGEGFKRAMSPKLRQSEELTEVIDKNSTIKHEHGKEKEHFFEVVLKEITETGSIFLEWKALETYLSQVAPVDFDAQRFVFATQISEWMKQYKLSVPTITLVIKTPEIERQVFKPYKTHYKTRRSNYKFDIKDVCFYPEPFSSNGAFWLWYSKTDLLGMVADEHSAGLRLRKNNISIGGPERVAELFADIAETNRRFNAYYIGEIHIISPEAIPNARRDGFEDNESWVKIKSELKPFIEARCRDVQITSDIRNKPTQKIVSSAEKVLQDAESHLQDGFGSKKERDASLSKVVKEEEQINSAIETRKNPKEKEILQTLSDNLTKTREKLEQENHFTVKKIWGLHRKKKETIREILEILYETLDEANYNKAKSAILAKYQIQDKELKL